MENPHRNFPAAAFLLAFIFLSLPGLAPAQNLSDKYRTWIEEEAAYIITQTERQVFRDLASEWERDLFIEAFWRHRDPTPGTERNEFWEEHYRRLAYANRYHRGQGRPGWQPKKISVAAEEDGVSKDLSFNGILTDLQGRTVYQCEKTVPFCFILEQYEKLRRRPFVFADLFPIVPGEYKLSVLMKNSISKEFTTLDGKVDFPAAFPSPRLSPLLLGFKLTRVAAQSAASKPFVVRDVQLYSDLESTFVAQDTLHIYAQILGLSADLKAKGPLKFSIEKDGIERSSKVLSLAGNPNSLNFLEVSQLAEVSPGNCRAVVLLLDEGGRSWIDHILGCQRLKLGDPRGALPWLERARAVGRFRTALELFGLNIQILNDLGKGCVRLDQNTEVLAAWKKSLELDPNQPTTREKISALEKQLPAPLSERTHQGSVESICSKGVSSHDLC